jgi:hypothetical protein
VTELPYWRVQGSFYIQAVTAGAAESTVANEINSPPVQKLLEFTGDVDVHKGQTEEWDMNG